mmetsp:Transcript_20581/g.47982  ORF Transcript_20581/g.47982 Transcript_20581/m.47982 type:complete len:214 (-) Transcript_20581:674-1315(-)
MSTCSSSCIAACIIRPPFLCKSRFTGESSIFKSCCTDGTLRLVRLVATTTSGRSATSALRRSSSPLNRAGRFAFPSSNTPLVPCILTPAARVFGATSVVLPASSVRPAAARGSNRTRVRGMPLARAATRVVAAGGLCPAPLARGGATGLAPSSEISSCAAQDWTAGLANMSANFVRFVNSLCIHPSIISRRFSEYFASIGANCPRRILMRSAA